MKYFQIQSPEKASFRDKGGLQEKLSITHNFPYFVVLKTFYLNVINLSNEYGYTSKEKSSKKTQKMKKGTI